MLKKIKLMCDSAPLLLYYIYIPVIIGIGLLGFFIWSNNRHNTINRLFFILTLDVATWMALNVLSFSSTDINKVLTYDRMMVIGVFAPVILVTIAYLFQKTSDDILSKRALMIFLPAIPFILFSATKYNIIGETSPPDCSPIPGILYWYIMLFVAIYFAWALLIFLKVYKTAEERIKKQIKLILFGFGVAVTWALITNVVPLLFRFSGYDMASLLAPIGILFLIMSISYSIVQYKFLNIKLIAAKALTYTIWILIGSQYFFTESSVNILLITLTLLLSIFFGRMLIKSVEEEVRQKEELHKLSKKLSRANKELKRLDAAKTEFLSIASHQLRTPLTVTKGFISLLAEDSYGKLNKEVKEVLNKVYTSNENLINLVEDLLNVSRMESGRMKYEFADWDLEKMVKEISDILSEKARESGLYLKVNYPKKKLPAINMDGGKVREVITNFIDNAVKYTKKGGVTVDFRRVGENVRIIVSDTGIGIPKTELPFLFQKFSRGKDTKRLNATGTGLGLFVGKKIIEAHRGTVWAESKGDGKGSKFIIELPMNPPERRVEPRGRRRRRG